MNKGIEVSTGDLIGIINSDDYYKDITVISDIVGWISSNKEFGAILTDISFVNKESYYVRKVSAKNFKSWLLRFGWMPHPGMFLKEKLFII